MSKDWKEKLLVVSQTPEFKAVVKTVPGSNVTKGHFKAAKSLAKMQDVHADTARKMFGMEGELNVTKAQRLAGKTANFVHHYGNKPGSLKAVSSTIAVPRQLNKKPTKAEAVLSKINSAGKSANAIGVLKSVLNVELRERLTDVHTLCTSVHQTVAEQSTRTKGLVPTRKLAETALNYVKSVESGLASRDVTNEMLPEISKTLRKHLRELKTSVEATIGPVRAQPSFEQLDSRSVETFKLAEVGFKRALAKNSKKAAFVVDVPVVPIFDGVVPPARLAATGLDVGGLGGYPVMLRQRIICVDTATVEKLKYDKDTYIAKLIERLEEHSPQKWTLVTPYGMANKKYERMMYWIMPQKGVDSMTDAAGSSLREWGLAF